MKCLSYCFWQWVLYLLGTYHTVLSVGLNNQEDKFLIKKIKEYLKNNDKQRVYQDAYALTFIIGGFTSLVYLTYKFVRWKFI